MQTVLLLIAATLTVLWPMSICATQATSSSTLSPPSSPTPSSASASTESNEEYDNESSRKIIGSRWVKSHDEAVASSVVCSYSFPCLFLPLSHAQLTCSHALVHLTERRRYSSRCVSCFTYRVLDSHFLIIFYIYVIFKRRPQPPAIIIFFLCDSELEEPELCRFSFVFFNAFLLSSLFKCEK